MIERKLMNRLVRAAMVGGAALLVGGGMGSAQAVPRYQSPIMAPATPATPALPAPPAVTPNGTVVEDVVVRVNDQIISRSDVERSQQQLAQETQQSNVSPADAAERQKNMLRDMIDQQLLLSRGKELGINADAEVIRRLDEIRKQNKFESLDDLEKAARAQGVSYEDFKAKIRNDIVVQQVVRDEVGRRLGQMTQAQMQVYYDAHKPEFEQPEQIRLAEILIPTPADATDAQVVQAQAKADDVAQKLKNGAKFADLAKQYSGGSTAAQGGELGSFKRGGLAKVLEDQTYPLAAGEATAPIRTRQGFVILQVLEHVKAGIPPMKDVEQEIQQALYQQQMQPAIRAYLTKLREEAYVDIRPGFVDSGASSKQTKPIFSAYAPPVVKKKKNQTTSRYGNAEFKRAAVGSNSGGRDSAAPAAPAPATAAAPTTTPGLAGTPVPVTDAEKTSMAATAPAAGSSSASPAVSSSSSSTTVASNTTGRMSREVSTKRVKEKKIRREKVRFGQAPREALPAAPEEVASTPQTATPGNAAGALPAASNPEVANAEDPLAPAAPKLKKTRFSAQAPQFKVRKTQVKVAKAKEKAVATPVAMSVDEAATLKTQAAPLGLNGDTTKKKKKRKKGDPKERLQDKVPEKTDKFANPTGPGTTNDLRKTPVGGVAPTTDKTTLPPANAPAPGQAVPATVPGSTTPAPGSAVPAGVPPTQ